MKIRAVLFVAATAALAAEAQEAGAYIGVGSTFVTSTGAQFDTFGDGTIYKPPSLTGTFGHIGADIFLKPRFAVAGEISWRFSQADYAGVFYRPTFYSVDALYRPVFRKGRWEPELRLGLGGARIHFFPADDASCAMIPGCPASDHFQQHAAVAARYYFTEHLFLRPAIDVHHVDHLYEFGSNWVPEFSVGVGYSVGRGE